MSKKDIDKHPDLSSEIINKEVNESYSESDYGDPPELSLIDLQEELENDDLQMENSMRIPQALSFEGNVKENWKKWKQRYVLYMKATGLDTKSDDRKTAVLLNLIGEEALDKFNTFSLTEEQKNNSKDVMQAFEEYCTPKNNETIDRYIFFTRNQQNGESFINYLTELKALMGKCDFGDIKDSLLKDRIICGILNPTLKDRLLREDKLDLENCINICKASELAEIQLKTIQDESSVDAIKLYKNRQVETRKNRQPSPGNRKSTEEQTTDGSSSAEKQKRACSRCGYQHEPRQCPAYGKKCAKCGKNNHFIKMCRSKKQVDNIENAPENVDSVDSLFIGNVSTNNDKIEWTENIKINNKCKLQVKLDTGAQCNVISTSILKKLRIRRKIENFTTRLTAFGGSNIRTIGKCTLDCKFENRPEQQLEFIVIENNFNTTPTIIGLPSLVQLKLISRQDNIQIDSINDANGETKNILKKFAHLFKGFGCIKNYEYDIKLRDFAKPIIAACRKIPISYREKVKLELRKMLKEGIIEKVTEP